ncbi:MAG: MBL fold metallo-hydrolase [Velocimicrobium sp.]
MKIQRLMLGMIQTNCYIVSDERTKEAIVIDPADEAEKIIAFLKEHQLSLQAILLTHGHFDHIYGTEDLRNYFSVKVYANNTEKELLKNPEWNCSSHIAREISLIADEWVNDGDKLEFGSLSCEVIETPGHTRGSVCYYFKLQNCLFSGDTLFLESIGRSDMPTGNGHQIIESVRTKLMPLPDETKVYPGHGAETSIGYERRNNPYINENGWE